MGYSRDSGTGMFATLAAELGRVVDEAAIDLRVIDDAVAGRKSKPELWSVKEILGHLIDSAANNHQRFVRAQLSRELSFPGYEQDGWVAVQAYQARAWLDVVDLWVLYNHHLAHVIARIPAGDADVSCRIGSDESVGLRALVEDYIAHLRRHLVQMQERPRKP